MSMADRSMTPIDALAEQYFDDRLAASPMELTELGSPLRQDEYDDLSPAGLEASTELAASTLRRLDELEPVDEVDVVTAAALRERLELQVARHDSGADLADVSGIASGLHAIRQVYELMPLETPDDWATVAARLRRVPDAIDGWFVSALAAAEAGLAPAQRQVGLLADQSASWAEPNGYFDELAARVGDVPDTLRTDVREAAEVAKQAYAAASERLRGELAALATDTDAVGAERYELESARFVGARVDLAETYEWGLGEVARIREAQEQIARELGHDDVPSAMAALDADPRYQLHGTTELRDWMQERADEALTALHPTHFEIPTPVRRIEAMIAPSTDGGIWYTQPSEDYTRPGRMWWSVAPGVTEFTTWRELTTVYHEGVPGHHLQFSAAMTAPGLNRWRRAGNWVSGHGEGWALYAEELMAELGFLTDPGNMLGMLDSQALRAVRVVIDIGLHVGLDAPARVGGGAWTWDKAWAYFNDHVSMEPNAARFELNRYFGWPGQAPSYKIGQRLWQDLRETARQRQGADFDLARFHSRALDLGSMGLDVLRSAVLA